MSRTYNQQVTHTIITQWRLVRAESRAHHLCFKWHILGIFSQNQGGDASHQMHVSVTVTELQFRLMDFPSAVLILTPKITQVGAHIYSSGAPHQLISLIRCLVSDSSCANQQSRLHLRESWGGVAFFCLAAKVTATLSRSSQRDAEPTAVIGAALCCTSAGISYVTIEHPTVVGERWYFLSGLEKNKKLSLDKVRLCDFVAGIERPPLL